VLTTEKKQKQLQAMRMSEPVRLVAITTDSEADHTIAFCGGFQYHPVISSSPSSSLLKTD